MNNHAISKCQTFLEVDDMKFMAVDGPTSGHLCKDCYFLPNTEFACGCELVGQTEMLTCCTRFDRKDNRNIIWMRML